MGADMVRRFSCVVCLVLSASSWANADTCALVSEAAGPYRSAGTARVQISGAGYSIDLPSQPAICGAGAVQALNDFGEVHAGDGYLFETCTKEGLVQVFGGKGVTPTPQSNAIDSGAVLFAVDMNSRTAKSYTMQRAGPGDRLEIGLKLGSATLHAALHGASG